MKDMRNKLIRRNMVWGKNNRSWGKWRRNSWRPGINWKGL